MEQYVQNCQKCTVENSSTKEPLLPTPLPEFPWQKIATDLFQLGNTIYLIAVDYFSRFPEAVCIIIFKSDLTKCQTNTEVGRTWPDIIKYS